jgi:hypothetical protein
MRRKKSARRPQPRVAFDERLRYDIPNASQFLSQSVAKTWRDIKEGQLRVIHDCGRTYVPGSEIVRRSRLEPLDQSNAA